MRRTDYGYACDFCEVEVLYASTRGIEMLREHIAAAHPERLMTCGRRYDMFAFQGNVRGADYWEKDETCSYCGSISPEEFWRRAAAGRQLTPTDKNYKVYVAGETLHKSKFYFQHFTADDQQKFVRVLRGEEPFQFEFAYPGHFYQLPFFVSRRAP